MNIVSYPNAKINIGLQIIGRRDDGFHNIETVFAPLDLCDILEIVEEDFLKIQHYGISYALPENSSTEDLCIKAYNLLKKDFDIPPVGIYLYKKIPVGAGLGGGSSDAAFTLKTLNTLFSLGLDEKHLIHYASKLGSDCPFFINNRPALGEGKGDILSPIESKTLNDIFGDNAKYKIVLKTSSISISTAEAYKGVKAGNPQKSLKELVCAPIDEWKYNIHNDFETSIFARFPALNEEKEKLYADGALFALMSGSGSSIYGIFKK